MFYKVAMKKIIFVLAVLLLAAALIGCTEYYDHEASMEKKIAQELGADQVSFCDTRHS